MSVQQYSAVVLYLLCTVQYHTGYVCTYSSVSYILYMYVVLLLYVYGTAVPYIRTVNKKRN